MLLLHDFSFFSWNYGPIGDSMLIYGRTVLRRRQQWVTLPHRKLRPFSHTHESGRLWIAAHYQSLHAHTNPGGLTFEYFIIFAQVDAPMPMSECRDQKSYTTPDTLRA